MRSLFLDVVCCIMHYVLMPWHPCMKKESTVSWFCLWDFFKDCLFLNQELITENDLMLLFFKSNIVLGKDQTVPLSWLPPSWLHVVFKWNIWHILQLGCYFVLLDKAIQNSLKNKLTGKRDFFFIDICSFLSKLMWSFIWTRKALIQALRSPYLPVNWC